VTSTGEGGPLARAVFLTRPRRDRPLAGWSGRWFGARRHRCRADGREAYV